MLTGRRKHRMCIDRKTLDYIAATIGVGRANMVLALAPAGPAAKLTWLLLSA